MEHQIGGRRPFGEFAGETDADDLGELHRDRLAEHRGLGLDAADAPADDADAADHRRVAVRADERVGEEPVLAVALASVDDLPQVFEVHLVDDAGARRNNAKIVERLLGPLERAITLAVSLVLQFDVPFVGVFGPEEVDLHAVVDDEVAWDLRFDDGGVLPVARGGRPKRREVDDGRNPGEIL